MARSLSFGSTALYFFALLRLAFASAPYFLLNLAQYHNSPAHSAKGTLSPFNGLELFVSIWFQILYFTPLPGFFSPFPHGTCSLSVIREYLALRDGPRCFRQDFSCPAVLRIPSMHLTISPTGLSPPTVGLPRPFGYHDLSIMKVLQPRINPVWALPTSLAATTGIDFSFFSSCY